MNPAWKALCYDLSSYITSVNSFVELLQDPELSPEERKRILEYAIKHYKTALDLAERMFLVIPVIEQPLFVLPLDCPKDGRIETGVRKPY